MKRMRSERAYAQARYADAAPGARRSLSFLPSSLGCRPGSPSLLFSSAPGAGPHLAALQTAPRHGALCGRRNMRRVQSARRRARVRTETQGPLGTRGAMCGIAMVHWSDRDRIVTEAW
jgi:hypothetical protein